MNKKIEFPKQRCGIDPRFMGIWFPAIVDGEKITVVATSLLMTTFFHSPSEDTGSMLNASVGCKSSLEETARKMIEAGLIKDGILWITEGNYPAYR